MNTSIEKLADFQIRLYNLKNPYQGKRSDKHEHMIDDSKCNSSSEHNQSKNEKNHEPIKRRRFLMKTMITIFLIIPVIAGSIFLSKEPYTMTPAKSESLCIINANDPSGTTQGKGWPIPDMSFYVSEIELIEKNGCRDFYVFNLSKPVPEPLSLHIEPILDKLDIYLGGEEIVKRLRQARQRN